MRRGDVGLLLLVALLAIPFVWLAGADAAIAHGALIAAIGALALPFAIVVGLVRRIRARRRREDEEEDELLFEDPQTAATVRIYTPKPEPKPERRETPEAAPEVRADPDEPSEEILPRTVTGPPFVGTTPWGAATVPTTDGKLIVFVLPGSDPESYDRAEPFHEGTVLAVVAVSSQNKGALGGSRAAALAGVSQVYAARGTEIDLDVPADAPAEPVELAPGTEIGGVTLSPDPHGIKALWPDGASAIIGDMIPISRVFRPDVGALIGGFRWSSLGHMQSAVPRLVPVPGVLGSADPNELAALLGGKGVAVSVSGPKPSTPPPPLGSEHDLAMLLILGSLDEAEELATRRQAADPDPSRMGFVLGLIAWMRGDEALAREELTRASDLGYPEASASLAELLAGHRDPTAIEIAQKALDARPDEPTAIRMAALVHLQFGDTTGASRILVERGEILSDRDRRQLGRLVEQPFALASTPGGTASRPPPAVPVRLPHHARFAAAAARAMLEADKTEEAEQLYRRAHELDPVESDHVIELGAILSHQGRDTDAISLYDSAIESGLHEMLRFNRATAYVRSGQMAEAISDLQICVDLVDGWHAARVNLCSALWRSGDADGARRELERLRAEGAPERWVNALSAQIE